MSTNVGEIDLSLILNSDQFRKELNNLNKTADSTAGKLSAPLGKIAGLVAAAFSVTKIVQFGKTCIQVASETSNAWIGLNSILVGQGKSFSQAQKFINEYTSDGLIPLNNAITTYKNLALRGYNSEQIQKTMLALKNSATFARQSTYSLGEAVQTASEGLKNENSVLVDNAGVTKNVAKMWEDYAKSIGKTSNQLTQQEKIQAEVNGILEETKFQSNDAAKYATTYSGAVAGLSTAFTSMKIAIGNVLQPIAKLFIPLLTAAANAVTRLFTAMAGLLSLFGLKADSVESVSSGLEGVAVSADNASGSLDKAGNSASKSGKKAKGALASWDELNVLSQTDSSGSSGAGGSGNNVNSTLDVSSTITEDTTQFDGLISRIKELADLFRNGFDSSFGNISFDGTMSHLQNIKENLINIFTAPEVIAAANTWLDTVAYTMGQAVGAIARVGVNIVEGLVGSFDTYLTQNEDRIKNHIISMFNISTEDLQITGAFFEALGQISDVLSGDTAKQIGSDILSIFLNPIMSVNELLGKFAVDIEQLLVKPIIDHVDKIKVAFENTLTPIQTMTGSVANVFTSLGDKLNEVYDTKIRPMFDNLTNGFSEAFGLLLDTYNTYIAPILQAMADKFTEVFEEKVAPMLENFFELIGKVADLISTLWTTTLQPAVNWFIETALPIITEAIQSVWDCLMQFFGYISDAISGVITILTGIVDFLIGVFTGNWQLAWEGIKEIFSGIWETIKGIFNTIATGIATIVLTLVANIKTKFTLMATVIKAILEAIKTVVMNIWDGIKNFISTALTAIGNIVSTGLNAVKTTFTNIFNGIWNVVKGVCNSILAGIENMVNGVVNGINTIVDALNSLSFTIPDWVPGFGGKTWSMSIPKMNTVSLPRLAQGGYVKANTPQLAVIGDNKHHGEIVSPEDKMESVMMRTLEAFFNKLQGITTTSNDDRPIIIQLILEGDFAALAQILKPYIDDENTRRGVQLVVGGAK